MNETPFIQALAQVRKGELKAPSVHAEGGEIDFFHYQFACHKYWLSILKAGMSTRQIKLSDLKRYYGLKGRTAAEVLPQFLQLFDDYKSGKL